MAALDRAAVAALDHSGMFDDVLALPSQLEDALWRVESAGLAQCESPGGLVVAGMGGSAIGGMLARAALGDQASRPILPAGGYGLSPPPWTTPDTTVLKLQLLGRHGGDTCLLRVGRGARRQPCRRYLGRPACRARRAPTRGRRDPRAQAVFSLARCARPTSPQRRLLEVAALCGAGPRLASEIDVASSHLRALADEWGPDGEDQSLAKHLAQNLHGTVPVITGAGLTAALAYRWKTQINENAKTPAFWGELPGSTTARSPGQGRRAGPRAAERDLPR